MRVCNIWKKKSDSTALKIANQVVASKQEREAKDSEKFSW